MPWCEQLPSRAIRKMCLEMAVSLCHGLLRYTNHSTKMVATFCFIRNGATHKLKFKATVFHDGFLHQLSRFAKNSYGSIKLGQPVVHRVTLTADPWCRWSRWFPQLWFFSENRPGKPLAAWCSFVVKARRFPTQIFLSTTPMNDPKAMNFTAMDNGAVPTAWGSHHGPLLSSDAIWVGTGSTTDVKPVFALLRYTALWLYNPWNLSSGGVLYHGVANFMVIQCLISIFFWVDSGSPKPRQWLLIFSSDRMW